MNTNNLDILNLVEILAQLGLSHVVVSPGSRNAPLIKAFNQHSAIKCYSVVDERSAGFFGLGLAQQLQKPVAVVCTSGSALLNFGPAVVEAYYQRIPLLVISADRPTEWIGQGDGQAINQKQVFQNFSKGYFELKESRGHQASSWYNERSVAEAHNLAFCHPQGPVHINVPLSEPLYEVAQLTAKLSKPVAVTIQGNTQLPTEVLANLTDTLSQTDKVMILVGQHHPDTELVNALEKLSKLPQITILTETTANLFGNGFIDQIDNVLATITEQEKAELSPTLLLTFGGMVVSKRLKQFLRNFAPTQHFNIDPAAQQVDTYQCLSTHLQCQAIPIVQSLSNSVSVKPSNFKSLWDAKKTVAASRHAQFLCTAPYSDLTVFAEILNLIPEKTQLQIGNSTPVRYVQLFSNKNGVSHFCNRGVSGIDGCTSTAIGAAVASKMPTVLISGDISFLYDSNGLWNKALPENFIAIVINNSGGNIFRIIDGPESFEEMSEFIETTHEQSVEPLAKLHNLAYLSANSIESVKTVLAQAFSFRQKTIVEIFTPRDASPAVLKGYWKFLREGIIS